MTSVRPLLMEPSVVKLTKIIFKVKISECKWELNIECGKNQNEEPLFRTGSFCAPSCLIVKPVLSIRSPRNSCKQRSLFFYTCKLCDFKRSNLAPTVKFKQHYCLQLFPAISVFVYHLY